MAFVLRSLIVVILSLVAAACSDTLTSPPAVPQAPSAESSAVVVPAKSICTVDLARMVQGSFWPGSNLNPAVAAAAATKQVDSTSIGVNSIDPMENIGDPYEPITEDELPAPPLNEGYYDPVTGDPCWDMYTGCISTCAKWRTRTQRQMCYALCMTYYADCIADQFLPPSWRGCGEIRTVGFNPYADDCSGGGSWGSGAGGCIQTYLRIEVNNGAGWETWWEGWALLCQ
jgi:hypothetical protein